MFKNPYRASEAIGQLFRKKRTQGAISTRTIRGEDNVYQPVSFARILEQPLQLLRKPAVHTIGGGIPL